MHTLERLLACAAVEALQKREHILVGVGRHQALLDELEGVIAPERAALERAVEDGGLAGALDDAPALETLEVLVDRIVVRLMDSDHVDDIFAEDRLIRRDAFRSLRALLEERARTAREDATPPPAGTTTVELDRLGYVVATVAERAQASLVAGALERAAENAGATFAALDAAERRASFGVHDASPEARLELEEAITEELVELVDAELVELPGVEQILRLPTGAARATGFEAALAGAVERVEEHTSCAAACTLVDERTLLAALTPLTDEDARNADGHLALFVEELERAVGARRRPRSRRVTPAHAGKTDQDGPPASRARVR
ncbi:MAG: hypothetical protein HY908_08615, partial [Myxococcales bacterium]|nr:hypothetical protein [Myxococcales bacterium]